MEKLFRNYHATETLGSLFASERCKRTHAYAVNGLNSSQTVQTVLPRITHNCGFMHRNMPTSSLRNSAQSSRWRSRMAAESAMSQHRHIPTHGSRNSAQPLYRQSSSSAAVNAMSHNRHIPTPGLGNSAHPYSQLSGMAEESAMSRLYYRIMQSFPKGIQMAFAYGSGVFQQEGHEDMRQNMVDFILVVDNPSQWHKENLRLNPQHYSFLARLGPRAVTSVQEYGAGVYFNTLVRFEDRIIKYGVISTDRLISDLLDWDTLYVSGRLHKPVKLLVLPTNPDLQSALQVNLKSAVHAALLLLPEHFCEESLYTTIASLSYNGDFRMLIGEDQNKVSNIVRPNMKHFRQLYKPILAAEEHVLYLPHQGQLEQNPNHITQFHHLSLLPKTVLMLLQENRTRPGSHPDLEEVLNIYANSSHCDDTVATCINHIVWRSSIFQSAKTVLTAGARKSVVYSLKKLGKMVKSKPKKDVPPV